MNKILFSTILGIFIALAAFGNSFAGEVDLLVDKLVEKDVLTPVEAQILLDETKTAVAQEIAEGKSGTLPGWIQKIKLKGDIRTRYQNEEKKKAGQKKKVRERGRVRFRLKGEGKVTKGWKVGFGLATGGDDPRSTNQTMENNFSTKGIQLDYAYLQHSPNSNLNILAGKFIAKKNLWLVGDLLWDGDVNPEGLFIKSRITIDPALEAFLNGGWMIIEHVKYGADPTLVAVQPGLKWDVADGVHLKGSLNYYAFNALQGSDYGNIVDGGGTNSLNTDDSIKYDYDSWGLTLEYGMKNMIPDIIKYAAVFGDYISAGDPDDQNTGFMVGVKFGDKKVKKPGKWQAKLLYRELERDAWPDFLADSDFMGGETNAKGYELSWKYALAKNVVFGLDYYDTQTLKLAAGDNKVDQKILQVDLKMKF